MKSTSNIYNRYWRLNNMYRIVDKDGREVTFRMNEWQKMLYEEEKKSKKIIILKARQIWFTTYKLIDKLDKCLFYRNTTAYVVAHKQDKLQDMFMKIKLAFERLPDQILLSDWTYWNKPQPKFDNKNEYYFPSLNSRIKVVLDSRSWTVTDLHISELAFIRDAESMMRATMPSAKNANITIETTANWMNYLYKLWNKQSNVDNPQFTPLFIPRYTNSEYKKPIDEYYIPDTQFDYLRLMGISEEQIYRYQEEASADPIWYKQEYPSTPEEAFLTTWSRVFNAEIVKNLTKLQYTVDSKYDKLRIYKPLNTVWYIWVDTAEWWQSGDFSSVILRDRNFGLVAHYYNKDTPDWLVDLIDYLFEQWFLWTVWIERNNTWLTTITLAKAKRWSIYLYKEKTVDKITNNISYKFWWHTNSKTRPLMINDYEEAIRKWYITEVDDRHKTELYWFVYNEKKKPEAQSWSHDDAIMSDAVCYQMRHEVF